MLNFTIGTASAGPGEMSHGKLHVCTTMGGFDVFIPVTILNGVEEGPKLVVSGSVHGNEIYGSVAISKLMNKIDPKKLKGTVIFVPVTNISAFQNPTGGREGTRHSIWDLQILNRVDPKKDGSVTEQVWYAFRGIVAMGDYHVDIHSGAIPYVYYTGYHKPGPDDDPELFKTLKDLCLAFGINQVWRSFPKSWGVKMPDKKAKEHILVELGGGNLFIADKHVGEIMTGVTNIMKYLGMLEGKIEPQCEVVKIYDGDWDVYSKHGGFCDRLVDYGDEVKEGQEVFLIYDPFTGKELERVRAPVDGVVLNTGTLFKYSIKASMCFGKLVEEVNLKEYFNL